MNRAARCLDWWPAKLNRFNLDEPTWAFFINTHSDLKWYCHLITCQSESLHLTELFSSSCQIPWIQQILRNPRLKSFTVNRQKEKKNCISPILSTHIMLDCGIWRHRILENCNAIWEFNTTWDLRPAFFARPAKKDNGHSTATSKCCHCLVTLRCHKESKTVDYSNTFTYVTPVFIQGGPSGMRPGLTKIWMIHHVASCSADSAKFLSFQAELGRQWNCQNQSQPNPGLKPVGTTCSSSSFENGIYIRSSKVIGGLRGDHRLTLLWRGQWHSAWCKKTRALGARNWPQIERVTGRFLSKYPNMSTKIVWLV